MTLHHGKVVFAGKIEVLVSELWLQFIVQAVILYLQQQVSRLTHPHRTPHGTVMRFDQIFDRVITKRYPHARTENPEQRPKIILTRVRSLNFVGDAPQEGIIHQI